MPPGNLQDNPDYKGAYTALFELPERFGVDMATVSAISQGLIVSYEAVSFYEKALLRVEQQLFEQTETQARLHEEMYKNDELSSIVQAQDEHKLRLEEAHINAENAHRVFEEDMIRRLQEAEEANREISSNLEKEKQEKSLHFSSAGKSRQSDEFRNIGPNHLSTRSLAAVRIRLYAAQR